MSTAEIKNIQTSVPPQSTLFALDSRRRSGGNGYNFNLPNPGFNRNLNRLRIGTIRAHMHLPNVTIYNNQMSFTRTSGPGSPITTTITVPNGWYPRADSFVTTLLALMNAADTLGGYTQVGSWDNVFNTFTIKAGDLYVWSVTGGNMTTQSFFFNAANLTGNQVIFRNAHLIWTQGIYVICPEINRQINQGNQEANYIGNFLIYFRVDQGLQWNSINNIYDSQPEMQLYSSMTFEQLSIQLRDDYGNPIDSLIPIDRSFNKDNDWIRVDLLIQGDPTK